jgi:hypothetical protein
MRRLAYLSALVMALAVPATVQAAPLVISGTLANINYAYDDGTGTGSVCDSAGCSRGTADALQGLAFQDAGADVGSLSSPGTVLGWDFLLTGADFLLANAEADGSISDTGTGGHFDFLINGAYGVGVTINNWEATYAPGDAGLLFSFTGFGSVTSIDGQNLPFGFVMELPIVISFSSVGVLDGVTTDATRILGFSSSGSADMISPTGERDIPVPEPTSMLLLGTGLVGVASRLRRRTKA